MARMQYIAPLSPARFRVCALALGVMLAGLGCSECEDDYDCPDTRICADGVCEGFVCRRDEDCPPGNTCAANACQETASMPAPDAPDAVVVRPGR